ncbi:MAG: alpha/beta fold hydrolase [Paracoccaceae bacterium]
MTITLPRLGETMEEARVTDWLVSVGKAFRRGDVLLEVETDKTVVEVPALLDGVLTAQLVSPGDMVALDQPIAEIEAEGAVSSSASEVTAPMQTAPVSPKVAPAPTVAVVVGPRPAASPAARAAARRAGVDLSLVQGSGRRGRITAADVGGNTDGAVTTVLLHGLFDSVRGWRDLPRRLAASGQTVLALDLPGHGTNTASADDLEAVADQIATVLPVGPLHLIGHSLGAAAAVRLAMRLGTRVVGTILCAPAGIGARINPDFTDGMLQAQTPAALARALALLDGGPLSATALTQELGRLRLQRAAQAPLAASVAQGGVQQIDITGDLARLSCPVTVLFGTSDRILDWRDVANLPPQVAIHLIRGAGHLPQHAAPDLLLRLAHHRQPDERRAAKA